MMSSCPEGYSKVRVQIDVDGTDDIETISFQAAESDNGKP
jgi:hypothetical protein